MASPENLADAELGRDALELGRHGALLTGQARLRVLRGGGFGGLAAAALLGALALRLAGLGHGLLDHRRHGRAGRRGPLGLDLGFRLGRGLATRVLGLARLLAVEDRGDQVAGDPLRLRIGAVLGTGAAEEPGVDQEERDLVDLRVRGDAELVGLVGDQRVGPVAVRDRFQDARRRHAAALDPLVRGHHRPDRAVGVRGRQLGRLHQRLGPALADPDHVPRREGVALARVDDHVGAEDPVERLFDPVPVRGEDHVGSEALRRLAQEPLGDRLTVLLGVLVLAVEEGAGDVVAALGLGEEGTDLLVARHEESMVPGHAGAVG